MSRYCWCPQRESNFLLATTMRHFFYEGTFFWPFLTAVFLTCTNLLKIVLKWSHFSSQLHLHCIFQVYTFSRAKMQQQNNCLFFAAPFPPACQRAAAANSTLFYLLLSCRRSFHTTLKLISLYLLENFLWKLLFKDSTAPLKWHATHFSTSLQLTNCNATK